MANCQVRRKVSGWGGKLWEAQGIPAKHNGSQFSTLETFIDKRMDHLDMMQDASTKAGRFTADEKCVL